MKFGYTIIYVKDVVKTIEFYQKAFGLELRFLHESNAYAEMETGQTALAFASNEMAEMNNFAIRENNAKDIAAGFEIAFITDDPQANYNKAIKNGATPLSQPTKKPWGQVVSYVRDLNGCLVEICSPITPSSPNS
jgi:uncharacterized glyoxalase superfamily protein PhnB